MHDRDELPENGNSLPRPRSKWHDKKRLKKDNRNAAHVCHARGERYLTSILLPWPRASVKCTRSLVPIGIGVASRRLAPIPFTMFAVVYTNEIAQNSGQKCGSLPYSSSPREWYIRAKTRSAIWGAGRAAAEKRRFINSPSLTSTRSFSPSLALRTSRALFTPPARETRFTRRCENSHCARYRTRERENVQWRGSDSLSHYRKLSRVSRVVVAARATLPHVIALCPFVLAALPPWRRKLPRQSGRGASRPGLSLKDVI